MVNKLQDGKVRWNQFHLENVYIDVVGNNLWQKKLVLKIIADRESILSNAIKHSSNDLIQGLANLKLIINKSFKAKLARIKVESEIKVYKQIIANLQVQDIAIKVIDVATRNHYIQLEKASGD